MPELPEVETVRRGLEPLVIGKTVRSVCVRERRLRQPVTHGLEKIVPGKTVAAISRRGKYLLLSIGDGTLLVHLGMSGRLRALPAATSAATPIGKHDHVDVTFSDGSVMRYTDPRRFGLVLWMTGDPMLHPLLSDLGPEPLGNTFGNRYLFEKTRRKSTAIKSLVMDSKVVVGVGNIYASEALFAAGIHPLRAASTLNAGESRKLVAAIRQVLRRAIKAGGTTLRDFISATGNPGYFQQELNVYGRDGEACPQCGTVIDMARQNQRSTFYCPRCQPM